MMKHFDEESYDLTKPEGLRALHTRMHDLTTALWAHRNSVNTLVMLMKEAQVASDPQIELPLEEIT